MTRLPTPGSDEGSWGGILNDFLLQAHDSTGLLKAGSVSGSALDTNVVTTTKIADTTITVGKLDAGVQSTLSQVSSKYTKPAPGIPSTDLTAAVQADLTKAASSVQTVNTLAPDVSGAVNLVASDVGAVSTTQIGVANGVAELDATGKVPTSQLPAAQASSTGEVYPLAGYGFISATVSLDAAQSGSSVGTQLARAWVPAGTAITGLGTYLGSASTPAAGGENSFAVYSNSGTLLSQTISDDMLWSSTGWTFRDLPAPIAAQPAGYFVYVGIMVTGMGAAVNIPYARQLSSMSLFNGGKIAHVRTVYFTGLTSWPGTLNPASGTSYEWIPLVVLT